MLLAASARAGDDVPPPDVVATEATGLAVTVSPSTGPVVIAAGGTLWRLPRTGGEAEAVTGPEVLAAHPRVAADGRRVVYEVAHGARVHLALLDLVSGESRDLTSGDVTDVEPAWRADGGRVVFASDRGGDFGLWELDLGQGTMRQLTVEPGDEREPAPDPSGRYVAFVRPRGRDAGLHVLEDGRAGATLLVAGEDFHAPAWRPDGSVVTFVAGGTPAPQLQMAILSEPPVVKPVSRGEGVEPSPATWLDRSQLLYAADGHLRVREFGAATFRDVPFSVRLKLQVPPPTAPARLEDAELGRAAMVRGPVPLPGGGLVVALRGDLWVADDDGRPQRALTAGDALEAEPALAPDGHTLAYTSDAGGTPQVWLTDVAGGTPRRVTDEPGGAARPVWSQAGDRLAWQAPATDGAVAVRVAPPRATAPAVTVATVPPGAGRPAFTPDGAFLAVASWNAEGGGAARLLLYPVTGPTAGRAATPAAPRTVTLLRETMAPGANDLAWSPDGSQLAIASARGVTLLAATPSGLVGPEWRRLTDRPARSLAWSADGASLWLTEDESLVRVPLAAGSPARHAAVQAADAPAGSAGRRIVRAERVFDGAGYRYRQELVIEDGRVVALRAWSDETQDVIDARGRTVLPGLLDALLAAPAAPDARVGRRLLAAGITAVHFAPEDAPSVQALAEVWRAGGRGPRILRSAPVATAGRSSAPVPPPEPTGLPAGWTIDWRDALHGTGLALVRAASSGGALPSLRQDAVDTLARTGIAWLPAIAARAAPLLVEDRPDVVTLAGDDPVVRAWRTALDQSGPALRQWLRGERQTIGRVWAGGGHVVAAGGLGAGPPAAALHATLALLGGAGIPPPEWLQTALRNPARLLGLEGQLGCLAPGCQADLVVVDGDPLRDPADLLKIRRVLLGGVDVTGDPALEKFTPGPGTRRQPASHGHSSATRSGHPRPRAAHPSKNFTN